MKKILLLLISLLFVSCANLGLYEENYKGSKMPQRDFSKNNPNKSYPVVHQKLYKDFFDGILSLDMNKYEVIGISQFVGPQQNPKHLEELAIEKGADIVLYGISYVDVYEEIPGYKEKEYRQIAFFYRLRDSVKSAK